MLQESPETSATRPASCVRFSAGEYTKIKEDAISTGKSIPTLLKEKYFKGRRPQPLMSHADVGRHFGELGRIGNNLNQLTRRLNSGIREGFVEELQEIQVLFDRLWRFLSSTYCRCDRKQWR